MTSLEHAVLLGRYFYTRKVVAHAHKSRIDKTDRKNRNSKQDVIINHDTYDGRTFVARVEVKTKRRPTFDFSTLFVLTLYYIIFTYRPRAPALSFARGRRRRRIGGKLSNS